MNDLVEALVNQSIQIDQKLLEDMLWALSFPSINGSCSDQENSNDIHPYEIMFHYPGFVQYMEKGDEMDPLDVQNSKQFLRIGPQNKRSVKAIPQAQPDRQMLQSDPRKEVIAFLRKAHQEMHKVTELLASEGSSVQKTIHETVAHEAMDVIKKLEGQLCHEQPQETNGDSAAPPPNLPSADILSSIPEPAAAIPGTEAVMTTSAGLVFNEDIWSAAKGGNLELFKRIKHSNPSLDFTTPQDPNNNSPLYYSCLCGHVELCHLLLEWVGGPGQVETTELLRCKTNALNRHIKDLLTGSKAIVDIRIEIENIVLDDDEGGNLLEAFYLFGKEEEEGFL